MNSLISMLLVFSLGILCSNVENAKILTVFPFPSQSHFILGATLAEALADRGHNVTFINSFPDKTSRKIRDISTEDFSQLFKEDKNRLWELNRTRMILQALNVIDISLKTTRLLFENKNMQELMKSNEDFDVIIVDHYINDPIVGLGYYFKAPVILLASTDATLSSYTVANPIPSSYVPNKYSTFSSHMNFWERLLNFLGNIALDIIREIIFLPAQKQIFEEFISKDVPLESVIYNVSLLLSNSHPSVTNPNPVQPNVIEIGGYHITKPKKLPEDLQKFMDSAKDGVVLFSMGSNLKCADLSPETRDAILTALSKIKQQVLWKFEKNLDNLPKNVKIMKWLPQNDILAHPNTKAFITHGGLLSIIETIYYGVPIIGIPIFGDQKSNVASAVENGYALSVPLNELNEENLSRALNEIVNNPKYRENAKRRSKLMHDRPLKPIDAAIYWIEYVIRNRGVPEFRSSAVDLKWYQLYMIDIVAFLIIITILVFVFCYAIIVNFLRFYVNHLNRRKIKNT